MRPAPSRSSHLRDRLALLVAFAVGIAVLAGCGRPSHHQAAPTTTLIHTDSWTPPPVTGPPSSHNFCTVLVAMYAHQTQLPVATMAVKKQILSDFAATVPEALATAPPDIEPSARTYLTSLASLLRALVKYGFDYKKVPAGSLTPLLLDPSVKAAGTQVLSYSRTVCHYTIGGAPTGP
ncbi:MAG TPA: hypothetical protein VFH70_13495 [Acidimicrobiales bacterium]|nr:hypothetical protein [Acidimicrobiales bacterium]